MSILFSSLFAGGLKPPTVLNDTIQNTVSSVQSVIVNETGCQQSASITSASLTEVVNKTGSGIITFAALHNSAATNVGSAKFRIVIDGVTCLDSTQTMSDDTRIRCAIGGFNTGVSFTKGFVPYNKTLVISISGDGIDGSTLSFDLYETG